MKKQAIELLGSLRNAILSHIAEFIVGGLVLILWGFVPPLRAWLLAGQTIYLPRFIWFLLAIAIGLLTADQIRRWRARRQTQVTWRDYREDTFDGLKWRWNWHHVLPETADNAEIVRWSPALIPLCPNCEANLEIRHDELRCPNRHIRKPLERTLDHDAYRPYAARVATEIVRRARSGEYKRALKQE